jgi:tagatose 1,6-diphosphate aldolase
MMAQATASKTTRQLSDPGKIRGLQRVTSADGYFLICALDHLSDFQELLDQDPRKVGHDRTVAAKIDLVQALSPHVSAFLLDAEFGLAQCIAARALPGAIGLMASIENEDYQIPPGGRRTRFRDGWSARQIKLIGADVLKLLWFFRPDADTAAHQRQVVRDLAAACRELSLAFVVEPIWYPLIGERTDDPVWRAARVDGIIRSAAEAAALGCDLLKVEFPGEVATAAGKAAAAEACQRLDAAIDVPWVLLSAGVGYEQFKEQVRLAGEAGASGFLAGRSIWRDAVSMRDPAERAGALAEAGDRLDELAAITRRHGRPYAPVLADGLLAELYPSDWYRRWQA